ncbi:aminodeoxychorismate/anthranilate synthase component II [Arsenicicoccus piscis]|uniref:Aminodeoxychorismate/anthranilate synthase component II n=1 Tax=Arsenicicoccus piscis TaxID=673954 RepID=A0ABQ6HST0_9MICO|nr:aminodeoxychorismate/anthranilate synthase component II [Arsenicicoccus piscis]MCH8627392.1 aminodeoxychorismate/anthranilate synthase component II [Arsenicicoccus piscis]GMA21553.1 aminodeoxychorismate/anthranilate synthase component II [Arsenicicoccus piscis]
MTSPATSRPTRILVVDNYDSFVFTIVGYLEQLGAECDVVRNDEVTVADAEGYDGVLISPGPGTPEEAGVSVEMIRACGEQGRPMLGVCLGHQALGVVVGATVSRAPELLHGKTSQVFHDGTGVLAGVPSPFTATRYHSLTIEPDTVPSELVATGRTESGLIMAAQHRDQPLYGVQFHPESVLTVGGHRILANWLEVCGLEGAVQRSEGLSPLVRDQDGLARVAAH